jgi:hypothetical protein
MATTGLIVTAVAAASATVVQASSPSTLSPALPSPVSVADQPVAAARAPMASKAIPGEYIVVLKARTPSGSSKSRTADARVRTAQQEALQASTRGARARGGQVRHVFRHALTGYTARLTGAQLAGVRADRNVAYIEPNRCSGPSTPSRTLLGPGPIDQPRLPVDGATPTPRRAPV